MKKLLVIAPHLSTGGCPQVIVNKIELLKDTYEIKCVEYSNITDAFRVQKDRIINLIGSENLIILSNDKDFFCFLVLPSNTGHPKLDGVSEYNSFNK